MDTFVQETPRVDYVRPDMLIEGVDYVWLEPHPCENHAVKETVRFVGYAPCPATVIVQDNKKRRLYIPRTNLFLNNSAGE